MAIYNILDNITGRLLCQYRNKGKLSVVKVKYRNSSGRKRIQFYLEDLCRAIFDKTINGKRIYPEDIESICLYGSVLYKNHIEYRKYREREKGFVLFGPVIEKPRELSQLPKTEPGDIDVMVILREPIEDGEVFKVETRAEKAVDIRERVSCGYGTCIVIREKALHIVFRSIDQFVKGVLTGFDGLSLDVYRGGVPVVGSEEFNDIVNDLNVPRRKLLYETRWVDYFGYLTGKIF